MPKLLSTKQRYELIKQHRKERDKRICDRIKAVLAYDSGYTYSEIAQLLLLDDETIRRHIKDYLECEKLNTANGGSESKLNDRQQAELVSHLGEVTYLYVKDICRYVNQRYGIKFSISGMTDWLKRVGFRYKKPHGVPAKANAEAQQGFIEYYQGLQQKGEPIYFCDSVHPQHQTRLSYGWILKGERKAIATTARQNRLNITGGICLEGHRFIYQACEKVNRQSFQSFLVNLSKHHDTTIHVIVDNARYHHAKEVKILAQKLNIKLHYLPPYSPNLNPIERIWKIMHQQVTYNKYYEKFAEFSNATLHFLKTIGRKKRLLRKRITDNFQILPPLNFAS